MKNKFPACFPKNLLDLIVEDGAEAKAIDVYRVCRNGKINRDAFLSTIQENKTTSNSKTVNRDIAIENNIIDIGKYSTSCFEDLKQIQRVMGGMQRSTPEQIVVKGKTEPSCGLSMRTENSKTHRKARPSHVDWWIYENSTPEIYFSKINCEKEMEK